MASDVVSSDDTLAASSRAVRTTCSTARGWHDQQVRVLCMIPGTSLLDERQRWSLLSHQDELGPCNDCNL